MYRRCAKGTPSSLGLGNIADGYARDSIAVFKFRGVTRWLNCLCGTTWVAPQPIVLTGCKLEATSRPWCMTRCVCTTSCWSGHNCRLLIYLQWNGFDVQSSHRWFAARFTWYYEHTRLTDASVFCFDILAFLSDKFYADFFRRVRGATVDVACVYNYHNKHFQYCTTAY